MVTDSGRFRYDCTTANTFRLASFLTERPFSISDIYQNLYADDLAMMQLRAKYTLKIQTTSEGVAYIYTPIEEAKSYGVSEFTLSRAMVGVMSDIRGIHSWVNFTETESGVLCEIRSNRYNINPIATKYGGGGHQKASGATLKSKDEAMLLLEDLKSLSEETV
jgi:phosphoesterase RecJ-like protein